jgi:crotonobetainyl-CoA:carnitine CoA-transferase CaiB-like acyl-CoA transferase
MLPLYVAAIYHWRGRVTMALPGFHVVTIALNVPGPLAVARLAEFGARVTKVEPPGGDPLSRGISGWYAELHRGATVLRLDLKQPDDRARMDEILAGAELLVTSQRLGALARLGLDWATVHARHPHLCQVAIVGHPAPDQDLPGHDLTYLAPTGLLSPPEMPRTLMADILGAERAASAALALLLARERGGAAGYTEVALSDGADVLALPLRHGLTGAGRRLSGGFAGYNLYETRAGWIALGALEPHFWQRCRDALDLGDDPEVEAVRAAFMARTAAEWVAWGREQDVPIVALGQATPLGNAS